MQFINPQVSQDLAAGKPIKLDLGSANARRPGIYSVDLVALENVDILADLNQPLDLLPDNCADSIYSRHTLEHVRELLGLMGEIYRVARPGARIEIIVPHFSNVYGYSDPTHVRFFGLYSMYYFVDPQHQPRRRVPAYYSEARFLVDSITIDFYHTGVIDRILSPFFSRIVNLGVAWQDFYERRLSHLYHAWQIRYLMKPDK